MRVTIFCEVFREYKTGLSIWNQIREPGEKSIEINGEEFPPIVRKGLVENSTIDIADCDGKGIYERRVVYEIVAIFVPQR